MIIRWLCRRLDLKSAVENDLVSIRDGDQRITERLSQALPYAPWVYHHLDYV